MIRSVRTPRLLLILSPLLTFLPPDRSRNMQPGRSQNPSRRGRVSPLPSHLPPQRTHLLPPSRPQLAGMRQYRSFPRISLTYALSQT